MLTTHPELAGRLRLAITRAARRLRQEGDSDLSPSLASALATIDARGPLTPSEVATLERVQRPTATRIVGRLEEAGLVTRTADPTDRRSCVITATPEGRDLLRRLRSRKNAFLAQRMETLSDEELATLEEATAILERVMEGGGR